MKQIFADEAACHLDHQAIHTFLLGNKCLQGRRLIPHTIQIRPLPTPRSYQRNCQSHQKCQKKSTYLLKISFQILSTPTMSYLRRNEGKQAQQEKYDIQLYVIQTSLDRFKSFHIDLGMTWGMKMLSKTKSVFITHWKTECT